MSVWKELKRLLKEVKSALHDWSHELALLMGRLPTKVGSFASLGSDPLRTTCPEPEPHDVFRLTAALTGVYGLKKG
ncbi:MAG: hypothetical protein ACTSR0_05205 [Candidatus Asgardarchaeia archaeon]